MGINLEDVHQIIGIPVMGCAVSRPAIPTFKEIVNLVHITLHIKESDIIKELKKNNGRAVKLSWLKDNLAKKTGAMPLYNIECVVRGYLLYLLGCTIFSDKTGSLVAVEYLQYLEDLENVKNRAWGTATLVHLYRQLGIASRAKWKQISGYLTLVQAWVHEHIPLLKPVHDECVSERFPRDTRNLSGLQKNNVVMIRELLDSLSSEHIDFDPYQTIQDHFPIQEYTFYKGCVVANRVFEPYMPDRMLRQLGHIQSIPKDPIRLDQKSRRPRVASSYKVIYGGIVEHMQQWEDHLLGPKSRGPRVQRPWDTVLECLGWFERRTMISQDLQPLVEGRDIAGVLHRHMRNVIDFCEDSTPLPLSCIRMLLKMS